MKKKVSDFLKAYGLTTRYSGNKMIMYVKGENCKGIDALVAATFGTLPFTISAPTGRKTKV